MGLLDQVANTRLHQFSGPLDILRQRVLEECFDVTVVRTDQFGEVEANKCV